MATWQVNAIGENKAEIVSPRIRYVVQTDVTSFALQALKGNRSIEEVSFMLKASRYSLEGVDSAGRRQRHTMHFTGRRVASSGIMGGKRFAVNSSICMYIPLLVAQLKGRRPIRLPLIDAFRQQFKRDRRLRRQLEKHVDMPKMLRQTDLVIIACLAMCADCYILGDPLACAFCDLCLDPTGPT